MLAGAFIRTELKTKVRGDQGIAAFEAEGEGLAPDASKLFEFAPPPVLGRECQLVARFGVQPDMDKGRVLSKPRLKRGSFRAAVRAAIAS